MLSQCDRSGLVHLSTRTEWCEHWHCRRSEGRDRLGQHWPATRHNEQTVTLSLDTVTRNMDTSTSVTTNTYTRPGGLNTGPRPYLWA